MSPFGWDPLPLVVGHRGSPREATENTLESFAAAFRAGARAVELDARLTRDGAVVVHHDAELGRVVPGEGLVEDLDAADLPPQVPTLAAVLAAMPEGALVDVELKADARNAAALPAAALRVVRGAGMLDQALVTSFDAELADAYARLSGRPAGAILPFAPEEDDLASWPRLAYLALAADAAEPEAMALARAHGRRVLAWTVNGEDEARALLARGVESVVTDRPGALLRALGDAPARGPRAASGP